MKKNLIALAVAGAVAAPMAAQADATIYGVFDVEFASLDNGAPTNANSGLYVMGRNTRIGFKGSEDLGNGMKAIWQVENDLDANNGGAFPRGVSWATRNTFVGLAGGFGAVILGRHDTPYKLVGRKVDLFGHHLGDSRGITNRMGHDARLDNVVAYKTPNMGGFGILAAIVTNDTTNNGVDGIGAMSISATYGKGPLFVGAAYQTIDASLTGGTNGSNDAFRIAASYKFGAFRVVGLYDSASDDRGTTNRDWTAYGIGGSWKTGPHTIKAQYYRGTDDNNVARTSDDSTLIAVGYDYSFSKKTTLYAEYGRITNDPNASRNFFGGSPNNVVANGDPSGFGVGLRVKF